MSSAGGSVTINGTTTALTSTAKTMTITDAGPLWYRQTGRSGSRGTTKSTELWRKRVGVEPTILPAKGRIAGFEGREDHRTPCASAGVRNRIIAPVENCNRERRVALMGRSRLSPSTVALSGTHAEVVGLDSFAATFLVACRKTRE
jgi:hypothetical protein